MLVGEDNEVTNESVKEMGDNIMNTSACPTAASAITSLASALILIWLVAAPLKALALDTDSEQPATLEADSFEIDMKTGERVYRGNVLYRQGSIRLECDELVTNFNSEGELDKAVCSGDPGKFKQRPQDSEDDMLGEARVITLDQVGELVTLESRAEVVQGGTRLNGRLLTYNLKTEKIVVKGEASGQAGGTAPKATTEPGSTDTDSTAETTAAKPSRPTIVIQPRKKKEAAAE